jgi:hypothetical protein
MEGMKEWDVDLFICTKTSCDDRFQISAVYPNMRPLPNT